MTTWHPISTCPENTEVLLFQPKDELGFGGMIIGSIEREGWAHQSPPFWVRPANISGYEMECDITKPLLWAPKPEDPA